MKLILVGYDFSAPSARALQMAVQLSRPEHARLALIHVVPVFSSAEVYGAWTEPLWPEMEARAKAELEKVAATLQDVPKEIRVTVGVPPNEIVNTAENLNADLVVVGSTGKGAVKRMLIGSVADRVVHLSQKPVLVVK